MADTKISALTAATTPLDGTEVVPIVQAGVTKKTANNNFRPKQIQSNATSGVLQVAGPAASSTRVMTVPDANFTAARTDAAQTFTGTQTVNGTMKATVHNSNSGTTAVLATLGTANIFDDGGNAGVYLVVCRQADGGTVWRASAEVWFNGAAGTVYTKVTSNVTITTSGNNIVLTNTNASSMDFAWSVVRIL